jgi:hypothetical protein
MANKLTVTQGNTLEFTITVTDSTGTAVDLTGATLVVKVYNNSTIVETYTTTSHTTPLSGISSGVFTAAQTADWPVTLMGYEIQATLSNGKVYSMTDYLEVKKDI